MNQRPHSYESMHITSHKKEKTNKPNSRKLASIKVHVAKKKKNIEIEAYKCTLEKGKEGTLVKSPKDQITQKYYDLAYFYIE